MTDHAKCEVCGEDSVVIDMNGRKPYHYCQIHHERYCRCMTHEQIVKEYEASRTK